MNIFLNAHVTIMHKKNTSKQKKATKRKNILRQINFAKKKHNAEN